MGENTKHRQAFERYFRLGRDRSLKKLPEALRAEGWRISLRTLESWSSNFGWPAKIREVEREARAADRTRQIEERREARERQAKLGQYLQQRGLGALEKVSDDQIAAALAHRMIKDGAAIEREARGLTETAPDGRDGEPEIHEVHVVMGGPTEAFMFPDPDDPLNQTPAREAEYADGNDAD